MFILEGLPPALKSLLAQEDRRSPIWIVGGAIRDAVLRRRSRDLDFTVAGDAISLARSSADRLKAQVYILDDERGAARVLYQAPEGIRHTFDFAQMRGDTLEADLRDRDFTINAMAVRITAPEEMIDPCGGLQHLRDRMVELCREDAIRLDPIRGLRAVRIASDLNFRISPKVITAIRATRSLEAISAERLRDELFHTLSLNDPGPAMQLLAHLDLLSLIFNRGAAADTDRGWSFNDRYAMDTALRGFRHAVAILQLLSSAPDIDSAAQATLGLLTWELGRFRQPLDHYLHEELSFGRCRRALLLLTSFLQPMAKGMGSQNSSTSEAETTLSQFHPRFESIATRLRISQDELDWMFRWDRALRHLEKPIDPSTSTALMCYRYFRDVRDAGVGAVLSMLAYTLARQIEPPNAELWAARLDIAHKLLEAWFEKFNDLVNPPHLIDGHDVMGILKIEPGLEVG